MYFFDILSLMMIPHTIQKNSVEIINYQQFLTFLFISVTNMVLQIGLVKILVDVAKSCRCRKDTCRCRYPYFI